MLLLCCCCTHVGIDECSLDGPVDLESNRIVRALQVDVAELPAPLEDAGGASRPALVADHREQIGFVPARAVGRRCAARVMQAA